MSQARVGLVSGGVETLSGFTPLFHECRGALAAGHFVVVPFAQGTQIGVGIVVIRNNVIDLIRTVQAFNARVGDELAGEIVTLEDVLPNGRPILW